LVSCLFFEDFPEGLSIADVRHGGEKYRSAGCGRKVALRSAPGRATCGILLESSGIRRWFAYGGGFMAQNFQNHAKYVPVFHLFVLPVLLFDFVWAIVRAVRVPSGGSVEALAVALALLLLALYARMFALAVQDRVIRLEMQLRMQGVLPANLRPRIPEFTLNQLVALRFASDSELPALAGKVLGENLNDRKTIKRMIQNWRADDLRA
jgi:Family of unknown function (DUF6526)